MAAANRHSDEPHLLRDHVLLLALASVSDKDQLGGNAAEGRL